MKRATTFLLISCLLVSNTTTVTLDNKTRAKDAAKIVLKYIGGCILGSLSIGTAAASTTGVGILCIKGHPYAILLTPAGLVVSATLAHNSLLLIKSASKNLLMYDEPKRPKNTGLEFRPDLQIIQSAVSNLYNLCKKQQD